WSSDVCSSDLEAFAVALDPALAEARRAVEIERFLRRVAPRIQHEVAAHQEIRARHAQLDPPFAGEPAGEPDMIGMEMRDDEARYRFAVQTCLKYLPPERLHFIGGNARIHHRPAITIFQQPEIDMVKLEGKRHAHPEYAGRDLHHFRRTRHPLERVVQIVALDGSLGNIGHERSRQVRCATTRKRSW